MTQRKPQRGGRPAFTLVELMVVITIIAILVALLTGAVMKALTKGPELQTSSEIGEMQSKLSAMANSTGLTIVPSQLHLSKLNNYNPAIPLDRASVTFLQQRFGKRSCFDFKAPPPGKFIDWNGDNVPAEELVLEGEQVLVFLLGGVPLNANGSTAMVGFSSNKQNPAQVPFNGEHRDGPFFDFQPNRLKPMQSMITGNTAGALFPAYVDPWKQVGGLAKEAPFAFFASSNTEGGGLYTSDCPSLGVTPYIQSTSGGLTVWVNPSSYQIISAGKDGKFGAGGALWGKAGTTDPNGKDDQSNFSAHLLGVAP